MGRKIKLEDDIQQRLILAIERGLTIADACEYSGISEKTYYNWLNKDTTQIKNDEERNEIQDENESLLSDIMSEG